MRKRLIGVAVGVVVQVPVLFVLLRAVFDMHNRFSSQAALLLPYAAFADRLVDPPGAVMLVAAVVSVLQFPIYGAVIGHTWSKGRLIAGLGGVSLVHAVATVVVYLRQ